MTELVNLITTLLLQIPDGLKSVWFWGALPVYLLVYLLIGFLTMRYSAGAWTRQVRQLRRRSAMETVRRYLQSFCAISGIATLLCILLPYYLVINLKHEAILAQIAAGADALTSMVIGLATLVLTVSVVIILFHKEYYLVFSISDVLKSYHFTGCLGTLLANCLGVCACELIHLYLTEGTIWWKLVFLIMEWCVLTCLATSAAALLVICLVMFSTNRVELRLLGRLYRIFRGGDRPDESQSGSAAGWDPGAVRINLDYLCAEYVSAARLLPIHRVIRFEYLTNEARQQSLQQLRSRSRRLYLFAALGIWLISTIVVGTVLGAEGAGLLLLDTLLLGVVTVPVLIGSRRHTEVPIEVLFDDTLGYVMELETEKKRKEVRIPRITLRPASRYDRFVQSMNSLTAFFVIALDRGMQQDMTETSVGIMVDWLAEVKEKHSCLYLPVFAAGFYAFAHGQRLTSVHNFYVKITAASIDPGEEVRPPKETVPTALENIVTDLSAGISIPGTGPEKITGSLPEDFDTMLLGHLTDLTREVLPTGYKDADVVISDYLTWLHED